MNQTTEAPAVATAQPKKRRVRSPAYPAESLEAAIQRVKKLYNADHESGSTVESAALHMGFNKAHGEALSVLAGLKKFGLIEMRGDRVVVTKRAVSILLFPDQERGKKALQEAILLPQLYRELFNRFKGNKLPSDQTMRSELIADKGFNPKAVDGFLKDFRASLAYAGISTEEALDSPLGDSTNEEPEDEELDVTLEAVPEKPDQPDQRPRESGKIKVLTVPLDPITSDKPQFAQLAIPIPISDEQKKRLINFLQNL